MSVKKIVDKVHENLTTGFEKLSVDLLDDIRRYGEENFVSCLAASFPDFYVQKFLVAHREIWESFTSDSWQRILTSLQDSQMGVYTIISFLSKYLIVDGLEIYKNIPEVNELNKDNVLKYFSERPFMLKLHKFELKNLLANNVSWVDIEPEDDSIVKIED